MKKNFKKKVASALAATAMLSSVTGALGGGDSVSFADVSDGKVSQAKFNKLKELFNDIQNTWYAEHIEWSVENNFVEGYNDGTFKPDNQVTEAEFATLLTRYVDNEDDPGVSDEGHWSQNIYNLLADYELPLKGYDNDRRKNTAVTRGRVAQLVAAKNGFNLSERQAIYYMYENDLSNGVKEGMTEESYGKDLPLTRAAAVTFLHRLKNKGNTTFVGDLSDAGDSLKGISGVLPSNVKVDFSDFAEDVNLEGIDRFKLDISGMDEDEIIIEDYKQLWDGFGDITITDNKIISEGREYKIIENDPDVMKQYDYDNGYNGDPVFYRTDDGRISQVTSKGTSGEWGYSQATYYVFSEYQLNFIYSLDERVYNKFDTFEEYVQNGYDAKNSSPLDHNLFVAFLKRAEPKYPYQVAKHLEAKLRGPYRGYLHPLKNGGYLYLDHDMDGGLYFKIFPKGYTVVNDNNKILGADFKYLNGGGPSPLKTGLEGGTMYD